MRLAALLLVLVLALPSVAAQPVPMLSPRGADPLSDLLANATPNNVTRAAYHATGNNLSREDVAATLDVDFRDLSFDMVGVVFGGGTLSAQARVDARVAFRVISVQRVTEALRSVGGDQANLSAIGADKQYLTANEFRATLAGEALAAFEQGEQRSVEQMIDKMLPDITVLSSRFDWSGTDPNQATDLRPQVDPLSDPQRPAQVDVKGAPVVLETSFDVQYLTRESLWHAIESALAKKASESDAQKKAKDAQEALLAKLRAENEGAFYERSAFDTFGITQLIVPQMPPGWDLDTTVKLPQGYTIEYASPDVDVDASHEQAHTLTSATYSDASVANPVALSLSSRFLVTTALLALTLLAGVLLRFPAVAIATRARRHEALQLVKSKSQRRR